MYWDTKGEGCGRGYGGGLFWTLGVLKTRILVRLYGFKINLNSSSQYNNDCSIRGGGGGGTRFFVVK